MKILEKASWLSLDIVLGVISLLFFINSIYEIKAATFSVYFALAAAVWIIYTIDHLRDVRNYKKIITNRHKFHRQNYDLLYRIMLVVIFFSTINLFFIPVIIVLYGLGLTILVALYLYFHRITAKFGIKEFIVAVGFSAGVFLYPIANTGEIKLFIIPFIQLFLIAYGNLLLISDIEVKSDKKNDIDSITRFLNQEQVKIFIKSILIFNILASILSILFISISPTYSYFIIFSSIVLLFVVYKTAYFIQNEKYRLVVDSVFISCLLFSFCIKYAVL
jgi:hypothetical protein